jgi:serine protease Do
MKCLRSRWPSIGKSALHSVIGLIALMPGLARGDDNSRAVRMTPIAKVFQEASPAVVNLSTTQIVTVRDPFMSMLDEVFERAPRSRQYQTHSVGSGFLIHQDGYIVTNAHVVFQAAEIKAVFADGKELTAEQIAIDREHDLAVLKVDAPKPLPHLRVGHSDDLMPGETVIAIGNPFGFQNTVTAGIISALNRELKFSNNVTYSGLIQTDASINPGNSGGPLLNVLGELIGINCAIRGDAQNIGFAIPIDRLHELLPEMLDIQRLRHVDFGLHFDGTRPSSRKGVVVKSVDKDSSAALAGLAPGDVVTAIDGAPTNNFVQVFSMLRSAPVGAKLAFTVNRGTETKSIRLAIAEPKGIDSQKVMLARFGISVEDLTPDDLKRIGMKRPGGLMVREVRRGSIAAREGLSSGDIITMFGGWPVSSLSGLGQLLEQVESGDGIPFRVLRISGENWSRFDVVLRAV